MISEWSCLLIPQIHCSVVISVSFTACACVHHPAGLRWLIWQDSRSTEVYDVGRARSLVFGLPRQLWFVTQINRSSWHKFKWGNRQSSGGACFCILSFTVLEKNAVFLLLWFWFFLCFMLHMLFPSKNKTIQVVHVNVSTLRPSSGLQFRSYVLLLKACTAHFSLTYIYLSISDGDLSACGSCIITCHLLQSMDVSSISCQCFVSDDVWFDRSIDDTAGCCGCLCRRQQAHRDVLSSQQNKQKQNELHWAL